MKVPNNAGAKAMIELSLSRLQNEGSQLNGVMFEAVGKSIKATE